MATAAIRGERASPDFDRLDDAIAALIKGMLARGDRQSDIAACFLVNGGRVAEINTGQRFQHIAAAAPEDLPPAAPYPSFYELWKSKKQIWRVRAALEGAASHIQEALVAVHKVEQR